MARPSGRDRFSTSRPRLLFGGMTENRGGKETFIMNAFVALQDDFECWFLTDRKIAFEEEILAAGGRIFRTTPRGKNPFKYMLQLTKLFSTYDFQAVWFNQTVLNSIEPLLLARVYGIPSRILHSHSSGNMSTRLAGLLHQAQKKFAVSIATRRFACSKQAGHWFFGDRKFEIVPNAFDVRKFSYSQVTRNRLRLELGIENEAIVLIQVAHLGPVKNHEHSFRIMKYLEGEGVSSQLLVVGDGPLYQRLWDLSDELGLRGKIHFLGSRRDIPDLMSASDVLLLPSLFEGLPYVILEAQANSLPVLASDTVSRESRLTEDVHFLPLKDGAQSWSKKIIELGNVRSIKDETNQLVNTKFDVSHSRSTYLTLLTLPRGGY